MPYDFDEVIPRRGTNSIKYDFARERGMPEGLLPMWVADMDFRAPREVIERLVEAAAHGIFGYSAAKEDYYQSLGRWFERRYGYAVNKSWVVKVPGVVFALATAIKAYTEPGEAVIIQNPVYYPFTGCVRENGRKLVDSPLICQDGRYRMDFEDLERKIVSEKAKLMLLCSPHNPVSRVWTEEELKELGRICLKHHCLIVSDEIHADFVFGGRTHHVLTKADKSLEEITVLLTAPSKTFNLAALHLANAVIPNPELRKLFSAEVSRTGISQLSVMGLVACKAAYDHGEQWLTELLAYLEGNIKLAKEKAQGPLAPVKLIEPEGTYLLWLDMSPLGLSDKAINELVINKARLWLDEGTMFGPNGAGFQRLNMACPRMVLAEALDRLAQAIRS
ncbi:MAG: pyridoxal phosphate-dependent aminotransferase [Deltaproteobacteria bacterium]|jgi:cystathionine beta-lyase|nr:pyridoxal phosphate-dependent aminotransferase [Deltaproteobacteria bacterium]